MGMGRRLRGALRGWVGCLLLPCQLVLARPLPDILKTKELRACVSGVHPAMVMVEPADCRDNCQVSGPLFDEVNLFAKSLGHDIRVRYTRVSWEEQFFNKDGQTLRDASYTPELLASGKCDIYPSHLTKSEWRLKKLDFVVLIPNRMMVLVQKSQKVRFKSGMDLAGKLAAVEKDTSYHTWLQEQNAGPYAVNPVRFLLNAGAADTVQAVAGGKADFAILDAELAFWSARENKNTAVAFAVGPADEIGWAFRKDDKDLQGAVQKFFDEQRKRPDSALNRMWRQYHGRSMLEFMQLMTALK